MKKTTLLTNLHEFPPPKTAHNSATLYKNASEKSTRSHIRRQSNSRPPKIHHTHQKPPIPNQLQSTHIHTHMRLRV